MGAKKDRDAAAFVSQLNAYRARKKTQLDAADGELCRLWAAVEHHARVLRRVRAGKYPLHQLGSNVAAPAIPANDLPPATDHLDLGRLPATCRAVKKRERAKRGEPEPTESAQDFYAGIPRASPRTKSTTAASGPASPHRPSPPANATGHGATLRSTGPPSPGLSSADDVAELRAEVDPGARRDRHFNVSWIQPSSGS